METICATGIRVSEVRYITVRAAKAGRTTISLKGKIRMILLPGKLCRKLLNYARKQKIVSGEIFLTRGRKPMGRCQIWAEMKRLCTTAGVELSRVFPHNLRHLFATAYYLKLQEVVKQNLPKNIKIGIKTCRGNSGNTALYGGGVYVLDNGKVQNCKLYRNTGTFGGDDLSVAGIVSISTDDYSALFSEEVTAGGYDTLGWFPDAEGSRYNAENPPELVSSTDKLSGVAVKFVLYKKPAPEPEPEPTPAPSPEPSKPSSGGHRHSPIPLSRK